MIVGIDPGKTGAIAMLYGDGTLFIEDMPVINKEVNGAALTDLMREFPPDHVYLESVNSFGMGRQSAFIFGQGVGVIKGVVAAMNIPLIAVTPATWKKHYALGRGKDAARATATRLFPKNAAAFVRKKDDGRAEAALIALWGKLKGEMR